MRVEFRILGGRKVRREFSSWADLCVWLKRYYPLIAAGNDMGRLLDAV